MDKRVANLKRDGWSLSDGTALHRRHPETFWIPALEVRRGLQPGQLAKLMFRILVGYEDGKSAVFIERMWVVVEGKDGPLFRGRLDNKPFSSDRLWAGMKVWFQPRHVIDVHQPERSGRPAAGRRRGPGTKVPPRAKPRSR